jgi:hypothetical protein
MGCRRSSAPDVRSWGSGRRGSTSASFRSALRRSKPSLIVSMVSIPRRIHQRNGIEADPPGRALFGPVGSCLTAYRLIERIATDRRRWMACPAREPSAGAGVAPRARGQKVMLPSPFQAARRSSVWRLITCPATTQV